MIKFGYELRGKQKLAKEYIYSDKFKNLVVDWPTGMGKFTPGIMSIDQAIGEKSRAILTSPMKSLTGEQRRDLKKLFGENKVAIITGDYSDVKEFTVEECKKFDIFIFTYEKLAVIYKSKAKRELFFEQLEVGVVITDEAHMITSKNRGSRLEMLLLTIRNNYPLVHFVYLSATIGDPERFASWCDAKLIHADRSERPIPLDIEIQRHPKIWMPQEKFDYKFEMLKKIIAAYPENKIMVWCSSRDRAESIAKILAGMSAYSRVKDDELIDNLLAKGVCYHDAGLEMEDRVRVEDAYRNDPNFKIISCTATLSMGVNLPADIVVMFDTTRFFWVRSEEVLLEDYEYHQVLGRAGRPGISKFGKAILFVEDAFTESVDEIVNGSVELKSRINEAIYREALDTFMYNDVKADDLVNIFGSSYDPIERETSIETIKWLADHGFVNEDSDGMIVPSFLGKMTSRSTIKPETALKILAVNNEAKSKKFDEIQDFIWLFDNILRNDEFLDNVVVRNNKNDRAALAIAEKIYKFGDQRLAKAFVFIFKKFLRIRGIISAKEEEEVRTGHEVKSLMDEAKRYIVASAMICYKQRSIYDKLRIMVETGMLDTEAYKLSMIEGIGVKRLERLFDNNVTNVKSFLAKTPDELAKILRVTVDTAEKYQEIARMSFS